MLPYFFKESASTTPPPGFAALLERLGGLLSARIRNGEVTERGMARQIGLSQPYLHHLLKGARQLRPRTADRVLRKLRLSALDLLAPGELRAALAARMEEATPAASSGRRLRGRSRAPHEPSAPN